MPYTRTFRRPRRQFRRRKSTAWYNKKYSTAQIARAAWRSAKYIRGLVNSEMFHLDNALALGSNQSILHPITAIPMGDTVGSRTGNSVLLKSFVLNGFMYINSSQTTNSRVMLALIRDRQQVSDTVPALGDIFVDATAPHTLLKTDTLGRFDILWRRQYTLDSNAAGNNAKQVKLFHRINLHARYNGTNSTDIQKNGIYFAIITSEPSLYPTVVFQSRLNYHDN